MNTTSLPTQDYEQNEYDVLDALSEDELSNYVVRITSYDKFTFDELTEFIHDEPQICRYVIGKEVDTGNEHYHLVLSADNSVHLQEIKDIIRAFIVPFWVTPTGKCPKGFGNKQYNIQISHDISKAVSYAVKLADFKFDGFDQDFIDKCKADSFLKKKPNTFKVEYLELCEKFKTSDMDILEFMTLFIQLKAKFGQQINMAHAYGYALSNIIARDPSQAVTFVENYICKD